MVIGIQSLMTYLRNAGQRREAYAVTRILGVFPLSNTWRRVFQVTTVRLVGLSRAVDAGALPCQLPEYLIRWGRPFQIRPTEHGTFQNDDYEYSEHHQRLGIHG